MNINRINSTTFNGQIKFARPQKWNTAIMDACKESPFLNELAKKSKKDMWMGISKKKYKDYDIYRITATLADSELGHHLKKLFNCDAKISRAFHREETTINTIIKELEIKKGIRRSNFECALSD